MDDLQYKYLDEERVKLWRELRKTQEQLGLIADAVKPDSKDIQKSMMHLGLQAAKAYNRMMDRDAETSNLVGDLSGKKNRIVELEDAVAKMHDAVSSAGKEVLAIKEKVVADANKHQEEVSRIVKQEAVLSEKITAAEEATGAAESAKQDIEQKQRDVATKHEKSIAEYKEISKVHSLLFGYTKEDGSIVEGKKHELDNVYAELEQKINDSAKIVEQTESAFKSRCDEVVADAKAEMDAVTTRLKELLPEALTAGLSSAYLENRKSEEEEQYGQLKLFKRTIGLMLALALLPIGFNLWLWFFEDLTILQIIEKLPREMMCIIPLYAPLFWLAIFANKRVNLSKRLIEEYKHKEAVSKTFEGLSTQIAKIEDEKTSKELQARLLYNTVMLSEKNPGELIKNYNRPDNPLLDVLNQSARFAETMEKLARVPGVSRLLSAAVDRKREKEDKLKKDVDAAVESLKTDRDSQE